MVLRFFFVTPSGITVDTAVGREHKVFIAPSEKEES